MRLRIALVYRSFNRAGSLPRATVELARHLARRHEVHVFSMAARTDRSLAPDCTFHDVPVSALSDGTGFSGRELLSFARNAARLVVPADFDVVHTCAPSTWVGDVLHVPGVARGEARLQGIPGWRFAATTVRHPGNAARLLIEKRAMRGGGFRRFHVAAPSVRDDVSSRYGVDPSEILVVTPAVNLDEFRPGDRAQARADLGLDPQRALILFCGTDFHRKGLDRAIEGLAAMDHDAELVIVGGGRREAFEGLALERGVSDRVRLVGSRTDAVRFYQAADVVVLPTRADVWGVTPIEAMACGVPPIVCAAAGSSSAVRDGETGVVLPEPFDVRTLRDALDCLVGDPAKRRAMGLAGIEDAEAHSWAQRGMRVETDLIRVAQRRSAERTAPAPRVRGR